MKSPSKMIRLLTPALSSVEEEREAVIIRVIRGFSKAGFRFTGSRHLPGSCPSRDGQAAVFVIWLYHNRLG